MDRSNQRSISATKHGSRLFPNGDVTSKELAQCLSLELPVFMLTKPDTVTGLEKIKCSDEC